MNDSVASNRPTTLEDYSQHALTLQRDGKALEAAQAYIAILRQVPNHWPSYYNLGIVFQMLNRLEDARIAYERAVHFNPQLAPGFNNLGIVLQALKRDDEAANAYQRALQIDPSLSQARYNFAIIQQAHGLITDSTQSLRLAVEANPQDDNAWDALYRALLGLKRQEDALATFLQWETAIPQSPLLTTAGLAQSRFMGDRAREAKYLRLAIDWPFSGTTPQQLSPLLGMIQYFDVDHAEMLRCYRRYDEAVANTHPLPVPLLSQRSAGDTLRVGYVSADFRKHVMGRIMRDVLREHDRSRISINLICLAEPVYHDALTSEFKGLAETFLDISALSDFDAARAIAELDLDILVDLAGHTMAARPLIYAHRPARKIVTHLGYHGALGLSAVDYKLTDAVADVADAANFQIEKPFFLDGCLFPFSHVESTAEDVNLYAGHRREGEFVFATFVNVLKLAPRCVASWAKILAVAPSAVLAFSPLKSDDEASIRRATAAGGIDPSRLRFIPWHAEDSVQRARYSVVDAVLDTFPYAGGDTTLAALDRDVPVITLTGKRNAERVGASLLTHLGVTETICSTEDEYVACAVRMASDANWHREMRAKFAAARASSPFAKVATHTRALEAAYQKIAADDSRAVSPLSPKAFFTQFGEAVRQHQTAQSESDLIAVSARYQSLDAAQPDYAPLLRLRATVAAALGQNAEAKELLQRAHMALPSDAGIASALAATLMESESHAVAEEVILRTLATQPDSITLQTAHARLLLRMARPDDAANITAAVIARAPADVEARLLHANALAEAGRISEAMSAYGQVLSLAPKQLAANYNAGLLFLEGGAANMAEPLLRAAIEIDLSHELAHLRLAQALKAQHKTEAWESLARRLQSLFPQSIAARLTRAEAWRYEGELARETAEISQLAEMLIKEPDHRLVEEPAARILRRSSAIALNDSLVDGLKQRHLAAVHAMHGKVATTNAQANAALCVGILLDVGEHRRDQAGYRWRLANLFAVNFAGNDCVVRIYLLDRSTIDESLQVTHPVIALAGIGAAPAAKRIRDDAVDVLFDFAGYRHPLAPAIIAHRPARVVIASPAFASVCDDQHNIAFESFDEWTALPQWRARGPQRPMLRLTALLPATVARAANAQATKNTRLHEGIVYATMAGVDDIPLAAMLLWKDILNQVPGSVLAVPAYNDVELRVFHRILRAAGIGSSRIVSYSPADMARFDNIDAVLDFAGSAATDVVEALDHGCPVIAMRGPTAIERTSLSVLARRNVAELAADSAKDFVQLAIRFANDATWRNDLHAKLAELPSPTPPGQSDLATLRAARKAIEDGAALTTGQ